MAAEIAAERLPSEPTRLRHLSSAFKDVVMRGLPGVQFLGPGPTDGLPNTVVVRLPPSWDARDVSRSLDRVGIAASSGSACGCKIGGPSHVLKAIQTVPCEGVRFSFGWYNGMPDAVEGARRVVSVIQATRRARHVA
jgi:cysteine desulfurase